RFGAPSQCARHKKIDVAKLDAQQIKIAQHGRYYQLEKTEVAYQFCFVATADDPTDTCTKKEQPGDARVSDYQEEVGTYAVNREGHKLSVKLRSIEAVIYYLGEWTRQQLIYRDSSTVALPTIPDSKGGTDILFQMRQGVGQGRNLHVV